MEDVKVACIALHVASRNWRGHLESSVVGILPQVSVVLGLSVAEKLMYNQININQNVKLRTPFLVHAWSSLVV